MKLRNLLCSLSLAATVLPAVAQTSPKVEDAWARPTVAGQAAGGGFLKITSPVADRLLGARSPAAKAVELHTMQMDGDVMRMREVPAIDLPAGRTVELRPGGLHVMFIGLAQPLKEGQNVPLTLRFEKAGELQVQMQVLMRGPAVPHKY